MMSEESNETMESYVFKTNDLCVFTGCAKDKYGQSSRTIIKIVEGRDTLSKGIEQNQNYVMKKYEILLSYKNSHGEEYTQLVNEEVEDGSLMKCLDQHKEMMPYETQESHGFEINHWCVYASYEENQKESEGIKNKHSKIMLRYYDEELRLLKEWLINSRIDEYYIVVAGTKSSMIPDIKKEFEASREEKIADFEEYSHGPDDIKEMKTKKLEANVWSPYEGHRKQKTKLDMKIDEMWMLMTKLPKRKHTEVGRKINIKVQLTIQDCISKGSGQLQHKIWRPRELKTQQYRSKETMQVSNNNIRFGI
jgi:hypothetical protein